MSKVATMLIRAGRQRYEIGDELPDALVKKLGENHTAVGDPPRKKKAVDEDDEAPDTKKKKTKKKKKGK